MELLIIIAVLCIKDDFLKFALLAIALLCWA